MKHEDMPKTLQDSNVEALAWVLEGRIASPPGYTLHQMFEYWGPGWAAMQRCERLGLIHKNIHTLSKGSDVRYFELSPKGVSLLESLKTGV